MKLSDLLDGLANADAVPAANSIVPEGFTLRSPPVAQPGLITDADDGFPTPPFLLPLPSAEWSSGLFGSVGSWLFGIGTNSEGAFHISILALSNLLPTPVGSLPYQLAGVPEDWYVGVLNSIDIALGAHDPSQVTLGYYPVGHYYTSSHPGGVPVTITENGPGGTIINTMKVWLVDP